MVADVVWRLFLYWWIRGLLPEVKAWMEVVLASGRELSPRTRFTNTVERSPMRIPAWRRVTRISLRAMKPPPTAPQRATTSSAARRL